MKIPEQVSVFNGVISAANIVVLVQTTPSCLNGTVPAKKTATVQDSCLSDIRKGFTVVETFYRNGTKNRGWNVNAVLLK